MHSEAYDYVRFAVKEHGLDDPDYVIEFGSKNVNGTVRPLLGAMHYWGIDQLAGPDVDEVADAATWRTPGGLADVVVCCEVLEHAPGWTQIVASAYDNLRSGGHFIMTCATDPREPHSAIDGGVVRPGEHYGNILATSFGEICHIVGFNILDMEVDVKAGDLRAVCKK